MSDPAATTEPDAAAAAAARIARDHNISQREAEFIAASLERLQVKRRARSAREMVGGVE